MSTIKSWFKSFRKAEVKAMQQLTIALIVLTCAGLIAFVATNADLSAFSYFGIGLILNTIYWKYFGFDARYWDEHLIIFCFWPVYVIMTLLLHIMQNDDSLYQFVRSPYYRARVLFDY